MESIRKELLDILVCPQCKTRVIPQENGLQCTNPQCRLQYPIRNGIPVMLINEARKADA